SFTVSPQKQFYHCFGCGAHGTAIGFLMEYEHLSFVEAIEELAKQAGVEVPHEGGSVQKGPDLQPVYALLEAASNFYQQQLKDKQQGKRAVDYLKERGLSGEIALTFGIGYAPPGWDNLLCALSSQHTLRNFENAGLSSQRDNGNPYDRFRDRIMFPIRDTRGRVVGFGGRIIGDDKPKYLNSPETPVFHKGTILYGLYEARRANHGEDYLVVVEGYMDVVALAQHDINNAVATLGTATTEKHLELLFRTVDKVVFCFDGDRAGRDAAWKALQTILPLMKAGREARFLFLPDGEDPDSLVRKEDSDALRQRFMDAPPLSGYLFDHFQQQIDTGTLDGRARFSDAITPFIEKIPPGTLRDLLNRKLEQITGLESRTPDSTPAPAQQPTTQTPAQPSTPVRLALRILLERPQLILDFEPRQGWQMAQVKGVDLLSEIIDLIRNNPEISSARVVTHWHGSAIGEHLQHLLQGPLDIPEEGLSEELRGCFRQLASQYQKRQLKQLLSRPLHQLGDEEKKQLRELLDDGENAVKG
ncbi:DNA primase, partial [Solemya velum gill symbiont]